MGKHVIETARFCLVKSKVVVGGRGRHDNDNVKNLHIVLSKS